MIYCPCQTSWICILYLFEASQEMSPQLNILDGRWIVDTQKQNYSIALQTSECLSRDYDAITFENKNIWY